jgi:Protein of unknown function (DUF2505)
MPRSFHIVTDWPATVEHVQAAFSQEDYWLARHESFDGGSELDSLVIDSDGTVTVRAVQRLGRQLLPGVVAKLVPGELEIVHLETWAPVGDREVRGQISVSASVALGSGFAEARLAPAANGSQLRFAATVEVKIPLLGGKMEKSIGSDLAENIRMIGHFTTAWIAEHV